MFLNEKVFEDANEEKDTLDAEIDEDSEDIEKSIEVESSRFKHRGLWGGLSALSTAVQNLAARNFTDWNKNSNILLLTIAGRFCFSQ